MINRNFFEEIYKKYNRSDLIFSDPIQFPKRFKNKKDIEISALISSSLAYGNVKQIINSLEYIFKILNSPYNYIIETPPETIEKNFRGFKHRFTDGKELVKFLLNIKILYENNNDMEEAFFKHINKDDENLYNATISFLKTFLYHKTKTLIPDPDKKSAFKRFNLFLRWVIRKDNVDLGIWKDISNKLIIPVDTHMLDIAYNLKITRRKDNSIKTALEITEYFKKINPEDPVKYDFALTRIPILKIKKEVICQ